MSLLGLIHLNHLRRHPWQTGLAGLGIAMGVAVVVAVQIAQHSAQTAFYNAQKSLSGEVTHRIKAAQGTLPESFFATLMIRNSDLKATPIIEISVKAVGNDQRWLQLIGIDPFSTLLPMRRIDAGSDRLSAILGVSRVALTSEAVLSRLGATTTGVVEFDYKKRHFKLTLNPSISGQTRAQGFPDDLLVSDIATVQDVTGLLGEISYIDLSVPSSIAGKALLSKIRAELPVGVELRDIRQERAFRQALSRAFDTNLTALSLLALMVGMFLVYNTENFFIAQRRPLFVRLHTLGVTRHELFRGILLEAGCLGAISSAFGILSGMGLASALLALIARTVNNFYYPLPEAATNFDPALLLILWLAGTLATLLAALPAAHAATDVVSQEKPASSMPLKRSALRAGLQSGSAAAAAGSLLWWPSDSLWKDFVVLSLGLVSGACWLPLGLDRLGRWLVSDVLRHGPRPEALGIQSLIFRTSRASDAVVALCLAAAVSLGMILMTECFRSAVDTWLGRLLVADAYLSIPDEVPTEAGGSLLAEIQTNLRKLPEISALSSVTHRQVQANGEPTGLSAFDLPPRARTGFRFLAGDPTEIWSRWDSESIVIASEPYAHHHQLKLGSSVILTTPEGQITFKLAGIYQDYASEQGTLAMNVATFRHYWQTEGISGLGVYLAPQTEITDLRRILKAQPHSDIPLSMRSRAEIQQFSMQIFDQTFAITRILGAMAMGVSLAGIVGALLAQQLERAREYSVLRALGIDRWQLCRIVLVQSMLIGLVAACGAIPMGIGCATFLIRIVNLHAFGWTLPVEIRYATLLEIWCAVLIAAGIAAVYPAWHVLKTPPARALRYE